MIKFPESQKQHATLAQGADVYTFRFHRCTLVFSFSIHVRGLDPSPKAWEAIAVGTIPIIRHFAGDGAYRQLPVVFVDAFDNETINIHNLDEWRRDLAEHYEDPVLRSEVIRRLMGAFWWDKVQGVLSGNGEIAGTHLAIEWRKVEPNPFLGERGRRTS